ncbi:MAG: hypothetical protein M3447_08940 [Acidobacteriota bacterium]|nr:hypothetical protein [Acidobacteriota bacterium]
MYKSTALPAPTLNRILAALPKDEYRRLLPTLELVPLIFGEVVYKAGDVIRHVYFPTAGILSLLAAAEERATLEVGIVGRKGNGWLTNFHGSEDLARFRCGAGRRRGNANDGRSLSQGVHQWRLFAPATTPLYALAFDADVAGSGLQPLSLN